MRGPVPRDCLLILFILFILAILLQTIAIKVLTDLFSVLRLRSIDIQVLSDLVPSVGGGRSARACPSHAFSCLKQDVQDVQDVQDGGLLGMRPKGLEDLNVYRHQQEHDDKVREDLNRPGTFFVLQKTNPCTR